MVFVKTKKIICAIKKLKRYFVFVIEILLIIVLNIIEKQMYSTNYAFGY